MQSMGGTEKLASREEVEERCEARTCPGFRGFVWPCVAVFFLYSFLRLPFGWFSYNCSSMVYGSLNGNDVNVVPQRFLNPRKDHKKTRKPGEREKPCFHARFQLSNSLAKPQKGSLLAFYARLHWLFVVAPQEIFGFLKVFL